MLGEAAEELWRFQSHLPLLVAMCVVFPAESEAFSVESQQAVVADGDAVGITAKITEYLGCCNRMPVWRRRPTSAGTANR
jgi:hypothetical protein